MLINKLEKVLFLVRKGIEMYFFNHLEEQIIFPYMHDKRKKLEQFLNEQGLALEKDIECSIALEEDDEMIATASYAGNILKCIAVKETKQGMGLSEKVVSLLLAKKYAEGIEHLFLYTKKQNEKLFSSLNFNKIAESSSGIILMEIPKNTINTYIKELSRYKSESINVGCIVANCNPFTLGHLYLIEYAAKKCDILHVFVVSEGKSEFPAGVRYELVKKGTNHIKNIVVHHSGQYIISEATFPTYFLKDKSQGSQVHGELDVDIFTRYIAKALGITKRFVGEEPYCGITKIYNRVMIQKLREKGIEVEEIPRLRVGDLIISASKVRQMLSVGNIEETKAYLPPVTYEFLTSLEGENIIKQLKARGGKI